MVYTYTLPPPSLPHSPLALPTCSQHEMSLFCAPVFLNPTLTSLHTQASQQHLLTCALGATIQQHTLHTHSLTRPRLRHGVDFGSAEKKTNKQTWSSVTLSHPFLFIYFFHFKSALAHLNKRSKNAKKVFEAIDLISFLADGLPGNIETRARCGRSVRKPACISGGLLLALHQQVLMLNPHPRWKALICVS